MDNLLMLLLIGIFVAACGLIIRLVYLMKRFSASNTQSVSVSDLPTVSVCIPARNETHAMTACLERVTASDYPKMEIIVLDDSSVDGTSLLIKAFAHAGVRFVEGSPLPAGWLGKVHAQRGLFDEASGDYILYMDVDTYIEPNTISQLMSEVIAKNLTMLSVLPLRNDSLRASVIFATLRHLWVLMTNSRKKPAATSSVWLVKKEFLKHKFSGFNKIKQTIESERVIAAAAQSDYRFLIGNAHLGVSYQKKWRSQIETSVRLLFPRFGGRIITALLGLTGLLLLTIPFILPFDLIVKPLELVHLIALVDAGLLVAFYIIYTATVWRRGWLLGGLLMPVILLQEAILLLFSMIAYSTRVVTWKGRPIQASAKHVSRPTSSYQKSPSAAQN